MNLYKRCECSDEQKARCQHPYSYAFKFQGDLVRRSTRTANRQLADRIATKRRSAILEGREGLKPIKPTKLSKQIADYVTDTAKRNRTSYKDEAVLERFRESVGDRMLTEVSPFH